MWPTITNNFTLCFLLYTLPFIVSIPYYLSVASLLLVRGRHIISVQICPYMLISTVTTSHYKIDYSSPVVLSS